MRMIGLLRSVRSLQVLQEDLFSMERGERVRIRDSLLRNRSRSLHLMRLLSSPLINLRCMNQIVIRNRHTKATRSIRVSTVSSVPSLSSSSIPGWPCTERREGWVVRRSEMALVADLSQDRPHMFIIISSLRLDVYPETLYAYCSTDEDRDESTKQIKKRSRSRRTICSRS